MDTLTGYIGDSTSWAIALTHPVTGAAFTPGGSYALVATLKRRESDSDENAVIQKASGAGITVSGSTATVTLVRADTEGFCECNLHFGIRATHASTGETLTVAERRVRLEKPTTLETLTSIDVVTTEDPLPFGGTPAWDDITGTATAIPFEPTTAPTHAEGNVYYNEADHSLAYQTDDPDVEMNIGREMWVRVRNNSGATITNGKVVYLSGATGQLPTIALARADSATTSRVIGVATHDIENNSNGYVTSMGEVKGINTSAFSDGAILYLSAATAGELTATAPSAPNRIIQVATVEHAHASQGKLFVHPETDSVASTGIVDATNEGIPNKVVTRAADGSARFASTDLGIPAVAGESTGGTGVEGYSDSSIGVAASSNTGTGLAAHSESGTNHAEFGHNTQADNRSFIARIKGAFGWFRGVYTGRIQAADTLTANRTWTLPDTTGTVALTSDINNANIVTAIGTNPAAVRTAADVLSKSARLYHDFSQHPNNTLFSVGSDLADTGQVHLWANNNGESIAPTVTDGALRGRAGRLFYYGHDVGEPIKTIGFEMEYVGGGSGIGRIPATFAFHSTPLLVGNGININLPAGMLHVEITDSGIQKFGFAQSGGANFETMQPMGVAQMNDGSTPFSDNPAGGTLFNAGKHVVTFAFEGEDCIVTVLGRSWVFRHPPAKTLVTVSSLPADGDTFVIGSITYRWKNTLAAANDVKIGATTTICATNVSHALNAQAGQSGVAYGAGTVINSLARGAILATNTLEVEARLAGPNGNSITASSSNPSSVSIPAFAGGQRTPIATMGNPRYYFYETAYDLPNYIGFAKLYRIWANSLAFDTMRQEPWTNRLGTTGQLTLTNPLTLNGQYFNVFSPTTFEGTLKYRAYSGFAERNVVSNLESKSTATNSSSAGSVYTSGSLLALAGRAPAAGACNVYFLTGFFADTSDDRRIALNEAFAGNIFDSGVLAGASVRGKMWRMKITMQSTASATKVFVTELDIAGQSPIIQVGTTATVNAANINFRTTSANAGDVQIYTYYSTVIN